MVGQYRGSDADRTIKAKVRFGALRFDAPHARLAATRLARNHIVRWKKTGQPTVWETSRIRVMSLGKTAVGIVVIAVVAGGAYYFVHERSAQGRAGRAVALSRLSARPAEAPAPPLPSAAVVATSPAAAPSASGASAATSKAAGRWRSRIAVEGRRGAGFYGGRGEGQQRGHVAATDCREAKLPGQECVALAGASRTRRILCGWCSSSTISSIRTAMRRR